MSNRNNRKKYLEAKQKWYDAQPQSYKNACKRPGSIKTK